MDPLVCLRRLVRGGGGGGGGVECDGCERTSFGGELHFVFVLEGCPPPSFQKASYRLLRHLRDFCDRDPQP